MALARYAINAVIPINGVEGVNGVMETSRARFHLAGLPDQTIPLRIRFGTRPLNLSAAPSASGPNPACTRLTQVQRRRPQKAGAGRKPAPNARRDFRARAPGSRNCTKYSGNGLNRGSERDERRVRYREVAVTSVERVLNCAVTGCIPWRQNT
jgi:hypothetical protein